MYILTIENETRERQALADAAEMADDARKAGRDCYISIKIEEGDGE